MREKKREKSKILYPFTYLTKWKIISDFVIIIIIIIMVRSASFILILLILVDYLLKNEYTKTEKYEK